MEIDKEKLRKEFKENNYILLKNFIDKDVIKFLYEYGKMRRQIAQTMKDTNYPHYRPYMDGTFTDTQRLGTYSQYSDPAMETLSVSLVPRINTILGLSLYPTYTYWRFYKNGDDLKRHKDRASCEISSTICIGYDNGDKKDYNWPIFIEGSTKVGEKGIGYELEPGDLIVYKGCIAEHWREPFEGKEHMQVFTHYNDITGPFKDLNKFDCRPHMGLPSDFKDLSKELKVKEVYNSTIDTGYKNE